MTTNANGGASGLRQWVDRLLAFCNKHFERLVLAAAVVTFLMIIIGAITRVTESGMGCGTDWPHCNGKIIPDFKDTATVIEFGHRLFALLVGVFALLSFATARRYYRQQSHILLPITVGFALYFVQSGLGAVTVWLSNQWLSVLLHLGNAMLMLAAFLIGWVNVRRLERAGAPAGLTLSEGVLGAALAFGVQMVGAAVAGNSAAKACGLDYPLCFGQILPLQMGPLQLLHMSHRLVAGALGLMILWMLWRARQSQNTTLRRSLWWAAGAYLVQAAIGAAVVLIWLDAKGWYILAQCLHVVGAAATWSMMVVVSGELWLQQQSNKTAAHPAEPRVAHSATTSS